MERRRYLVTYDISDDKRRTRVFQALRDNGDHAQYSVFICELTPSELSILRSRLTDAIHHREDQVLVLDLGLSDNSLEAKLEVMGRAYLPPTTVFVV
ncbi:MAG: CRISPR-associated endonuclease Cas2 [Planctomycetota bacterium]